MLFRQIPILKALGRNALNPSTYSFNSSSSLHASSVRHLSSSVAVLDIESDENAIMTSLVNTLSCIGFISSTGGIPITDSATSAALASKNLRYSLKLGNTLTVNIVEKAKENIIKKYISKKMLNSHSVAIISNISIGSDLRNCYESQWPIQCPYSKFSRNLKVSISEPHTSSINSHNDSNRLSLKELIIPCGDSMSQIVQISDKLLDFKYLPVKNGFGLFTARTSTSTTCTNGIIQNGNVSVRLLPTNLPVLVFKTLDENSLNEIKLSLDQNNIRYESIGQTGSSAANNGEIRLTSESTHGIEVRITSDNALHPFFNEGHAVLMETSIPDIQSARVAGDDVKETKFGFSGDCWSEARASAKTKMISKIKNIFT